MTDPHGSDAGDALNFDHAVPASSAAPSDRDTTAVRCASCHRELTTEYFTVGQSPLCASCRDLLEQAAAPVRDPARLGTSVLLGVGAALVGSVIYWAVIRYLKLEIGLVSVLTGYMVGKAMRKGAGDRGGRPLQVVAVLLVYLSVGLAYVPFTMQGGENPGIISALKLAMLLPYYVVVGSFPSGIISAAIIGFGMHQAWQLTAEARLTFEGPFRVGGPSSR